MKKQKTQNLKNNNGIFKSNVGADASVRPTSKVRQNIGITLIALVITIIVMLILVAVTISMAVNGGLFNYAGKATGETQNAIDAEQQLADGKVKIDGVWYDSIDDYVAGIQSDDQKGIILDETLNLYIEDGYNVAASTPVTGQLTATLNEVEGTVTWSSDDEEIAKVEGNGTTATITAVAIGTANITASCSFEGTTYTQTCKVTINTIPELKVGDYVNYTPTSGTYTVASGTNGSGYGSNQTFTTETGDSALKWRILSIDETTGEIELVAEKRTSTELYLSGKDGYNHAVDILNDLCEALYSNENGATARSINIEDINEKTTYNYEGYTNLSGEYKYGDQKQLSAYGTGNMKYPTLYSQEKGYGTAGTFNTTGLNGSEGLNDGVTNISGVTTYSTVTGYTNGYTAGTDPYITITRYSYDPEKYLNTNLGVNTMPSGLIYDAREFWIATRGVEENNKGTCAEFGIFYYRSAVTGVSFEGLWESSALYIEPSHYVRPVVSLGISAELTFVSVDASGSFTNWDLDFE